MPSNRLPALAASPIRLFELIATTFPSRSFATRDARFSESTTSFPATIVLNNRVPEKEAVQTPPPTPAPSPSESARLPVTVEFVRTAKPEALNIAPPLPLARFPEIVLFVKNRLPPLSVAPAPPVTAVLSQIVDPTTDVVPARARIAAPESAEFIVNRESVTVVSEPKLSRAPPRVADCEVNVTSLMARDPARVRIAPPSVAVFPVNVLLVIEISADSPKTAPPSRLNGAGLVPSAFPLTKVRFVRPTVAGVMSPSIFRIRPTPSPSSVTEPPKALMLVPSITTSVSINNSSPTAIVGLATGISN